MGIPGMRHFVGLDIGQMHQYSALAVLERRLATHGWTIEDFRLPYALRHLQRFPPGTGYTQIAGALRDLLKTSEVSGAVVAADVTGVGRAVNELFNDELYNRVWCKYAPITVVGSGPNAGAGGTVGFVVPKLELVGTMQVLLQTKRLKIASSLPEAPTLIRELEAFRAAPPVLRGDTIEQWRERDHDDLVLAVAVAAWLGEQALPDVVR